MSNLVWQDAWVLLAVKSAQGKSQFASREDVIKAGDFINHAVFLDSEIEHALSVLNPMALLSEQSGYFAVGPNFQTFWDQCGAQMTRSVHQQLDLIAEHLGVER